MSVDAKSGYWQDLQEAVNWLIAHAGGVGKVFIPGGEHNFVDVGEDWTGARVTRPAGISFFGAPTQRISGLPVPDKGMNPNDQVIDWQTTLKLPWDVPGSWEYGGKQLFATVGSNSTEQTRFSDIKLVGYRSIDPSSVMVQVNNKVNNVQNFRMDHCCIEHIGLGNGIDNTSGVIDHCYLINPVAKVGTNLNDCNVFYGVGLGRGSGDLWEPDTSKVLGQFTPYTVFIEDCYFEKWRHCVAANGGAHYVFRHNTIKNDFGFGSLDAHGWGVMTGGIITSVGTRAVEIYNCEILDAIQSPWATFIRGGAGVAFNNRVGGGTYNAFIYFSNEAQEAVSKCWVHDWWIWNNVLEGVNEIIKYDPNNRIIEGVDYFRQAPHTFNYQPYPYPNPYTVENTHNLLVRSTPISNVPFTIRRV